MQTSRLIRLGSILGCIVLVGCGGDDLGPVDPCAPGGAGESIRSLGNGQQMTFPCNYSGEWMCGDDSCHLDMRRADDTVVFSAWSDAMIPRTIYENLPEQLAPFTQAIDIEAPGKRSARYYFLFESESPSVFAMGRFIVELEDGSGFSPSVTVQYEDNAHQEVLDILGTIQYEP